ncbi:MAG: phosphate ABC transporter permease PstA [Candidatus Auribacterota bacterium]|jgi:phosphate transport system permease protein|nr:phosphate ABC transporter permease PstA [Candidatus Auribacterota bacterium]
MKPRSKKPREIIDFIVKLISAVSAFFGIFILILIIYEVAVRGLAAFSFAFFTQLPAPPGMDKGGVANAIVGTFIITLMAAGMGVPIGLMVGIYLVEFARDTKIGEFIKFLTNVMIGIPSIIIGLFVYTIMVKPFGQFSGYAGAVALAIIMLPVVARTTQDILMLVPNSLRESAFALGTSQWRVILNIIFRAAKSGLITGVLLAIARVSGETAPLLFTALNSPYWIQTLARPTANLTVLIYNYAVSPFADWQQTAWGASLLIMIAVLFVNILARIILKQKS